MKAETIFNIFVGIVLIVYLIFAFQIPHQSLPADIVEANGFPIMLGFIGLGLVCVTVFQSIRKKDHEPLQFKKEPVIRIAIVVAMVVVYINILRQIGFITSMFLFVVVSLAAVGSKRYIYNIVFSLLFTIAITFIFGNIFSINLPRGTGIFMQLSWLLH